MRYYFHVRDAQGVIPDEEGTELPNIAAARREAGDSARDLAMDSLRGGPPVRDRSIEMVDEDGLVLETLLVRDVMH